MDGDDRAHAFRHPVRVRFRDLDLGGHAHHSQALIYFEEARAAYWREVVGRSSPDLDDIDYILAEARVEYRQRVRYPSRLEVGVRVSVLGRSHFVMEYVVTGPDGEVLVTGETTQVMYDYGRARPKRISGEVRARIEEWDGPVEPSS